LKIPARDRGLVLTAMPVNKWQNDFDYETLFGHYPECQ